LLAGVGHYRVGAGNKEGFTVVLASATSDGSEQGRSSNLIGHGAQNVVQACNKKAGAGVVVGWASGGLRLIWRFGGGRGGWRRNTRQIDECAAYACVSYCGKRLIILGFHAIISLLIICA